jgi:hypothetical protein
MLLVFVSRAAPMVVVGLLLMTGCEPAHPYKELETSNLLHEAGKAIQVCLHDDANFPSQIPAQMQGPDALNSYMTQVLISRKYLSAKVLENRGNLIVDKGRQVHLVDAWGTPLIFQVPDLYQSGLVYTSADGQGTILPLPPSAWPPEKGPIQVWSLGPNGRDDRGQDDDVIPTN